MTGPADGRLISARVSRFERPLAWAWIITVTAGLVASLVFTPWYVSAAVTLMLLLGLVYFYHTIWSLADAYDCGNALVFVKNKKTQQVELFDIVKLGHPFSNRKDIVAIRTRTGGKIGKTVRFRAGAAWLGLRSPRIMRDLQQRIAATRRQRARELAHGTSN